MARSLRTRATFLATALVLAALAFALLNSCAKQDPADELEATVQAKISEMTLEQKVAQLFIVRPEALVGASPVVQAGEATKEALATYPVGGFIYFGENIIDREQTTAMLANAQAYSAEAIGLPLFTCVDEEGGSVSRVASSPAFGLEDYGDMRDIGAIGEPELAHDVAKGIAGYLTPLGFNVDFAPVADIASTPGSVMERRSFGSTADVVAPLVKAQVEGFADGGILCSAKHFPGIGGADGDSHEGIILATKSIEEMADEELAPFAAAIEADVPFIMMGHLSSHIGEGSSDTPGTLRTEYYDYLRNQMGYEGIIITDSLEMGAVAGFEPAEAAAQALICGADMVLMPADFEASYQGVLDAVAAGQLSEADIDAKLARILRTKLTYANSSAGIE